MDSIQPNTLEKPNKQYIHR